MDHDRFTSDGDSLHRMFGERKVTLTSTGAEAVSVGLFELIAYSSQAGFTRLNLTGSKTLDVKETTDQIDRLVRSVASQSGS